MSSSKDFKTYASQVLAMIYEHNDHERIFELLKSKEPKFARVSADTFGMEYLAGRIALACRVWEAACVENGRKSEEDQKALLRRVMQTFESSKFLKLAETFSHYLLLPEIENQPVITVCENLFKRLSINPEAVKSTGPEASPAFQTIVAVSDSFRTSLENQIFEFIHS